MQSFCLNAFINIDLNDFSNFFYKSSNLISFANCFCWGKSLWGISGKPMSYARICLKSQFHLKKSILTITPALVIQKVIVCAEQPARLLILGIKVPCRQFPSSDGYHIRCTFLVTGGVLPGCRSHCRFVYTLWGRPEWRANLGAWT